MADAHLIVATKRLGNDLRELKSALRRSYPKPSRQVTSIELKRRISTLAETWLVDLSQRREMAAYVPAEYLGDLNVHFQRLLVSAERATVRSRYDQEMRAILRNYTANLVIQLMQGGGGIQPAGEHGEAAPAIRVEQGNDESFRATAFVGHSFAPDDKPTVDTIIAVLEALGIKVVTGEKPKADKISEKVKKLIEAQHLFVGVFTRRDKLVGKDAWSTSAWVIDEKAFAYARRKKLILLKETGVESIGGIQGDYEYFEFPRGQLHDVLLKILQLFEVTVQGLRE